MSARLPGAVEPELLTADHPNRTTRLMGSIVGRPVRVFGPGGQIGQLALQGGKIGRLLGRGYWRAIHRMGLLDAGRLVNRQDRRAGFGMRL